MNTKELTQYMKYVKMLEARAYELTRIYNRLSYKIKDYSNKDYSKNYEKCENNELDSEAIITFITFMFIGGIIGAVIGISIGSSKEDGFILARIFMCEMKYIYCGFIFGALIALAISIIIFLSDEINIKKYNKEVVKYNSQVSKNNEILKNQDRRKIQIYRQEQEVIRKQYQETKELLHKAYKLNILHPKYQNFIAVCSLYEYLETGRCTQLTGHEGGYNIFEMEKRLNMLILKMDEIINRLDQIQANQHTLYQAIIYSNRNADRICNQISVISDKLENIEQNQTLIEYNTNIASSNTEFLKWMTYFKG